jgi:phosphatidylserine/phosphatidylglycerophosphate/cardiolipin synthase-like enzyme
MRTQLAAGAVVLGLVTALATPVLGAAMAGEPVSSAPRSPVGDGAIATASLASASVAGESGERATASVLFNEPTGVGAAQDRIAEHIRRAIDGTPQGGMIRMAAYAFDRRDIADALVRACTEREVTVQVVLNDNFVSEAARRLQRRLGSDARPHLDDACHPGVESEGLTEEPSFVRVCHASCRLGDRGNQHMKVYLFSGNGHVPHVVMLGSANLTGYAARVHWNDLVTLTGSRQLYEAFSRVFAELAADRRVEAPVLNITQGDLTIRVGSAKPATPADDEVVQRLGKVTCRAMPGSGDAGQTVIRISMYGWRGERGVELARRVAEMSRQGCRIQALVSAAASDVVATLVGAGVRVRSASLDIDQNPATGFEETGWEHFVHEKWMSIDGTWDDSATRAVWTGSENWSGVSLLNDELVVMIPRVRIHDAYVKNFDHIWSQYSKDT